MDGNSDSAAAVLAAALSVEEVVAQENFLSCCSGEEPVACRGAMVDAVAQAIGDSLLLQPRSHFEKNENACVCLPAVTGVLSRRKNDSDQTDRF